MRFAHGQVPPFHQNPVPVPWSVPFDDTALPAMGLLLDALRRCGRFSLFLVVSHVSCGVSSAPNGPLDPRGAQAVESFMCALAAAPPPRDRWEPGKPLIYFTIGRKQHYFLLYSAIYTIYYYIPYICILGQALQSLHTCGGYAGGDVLLIVDPSVRLAPAEIPTWSISPAGGIRCTRRSRWAGGWPHTMQAYPP